MKFKPKLTNLQAARAMADLSSGMLQKEVAKKYGVDQATISRIKNRTDRGEEKVRELQPCGTPAAYRRHIYYKEIACDECLKAWAKAQRDRSRGFKLCGSEAAYHRHMKDGEKPCRACKKARAKEVQIRRRKKRQAA